MEMIFGLLHDNLQVFFTTGNHPEIKLDVIIEPTYQVCNFMNIKHTTSMCEVSVHQSEKLDAAANTKPGFGHESLMISR